MKAAKLARLYDQAVQAVWELAKAKERLLGAIAGSPEETEAGGAAFAVLIEGREVEALRDISTALGAYRREECRR